MFVYIADYNYLCGKINSHCQLFSIQLLLSTFFNFTIMKRKLLSLLLLLVAGVTAAWAGDIYKISFNGSNAESKNGESVTDATYFSWSGKHNFNTKFNGCSYDGVDYTQGLKMEGTTTVSWTSTAAATVTIVQSNYGPKTVKFDGEELALTDDNSITGGYVHTIADVAAGSHSVTRGSGETGLFAIIVEYTGSVMTQLAEPEITVNASNGEVTIGAVEHASKITYTTDGTDPTDESTEYAAAFTVTDGTTIKAMAIGDGATYINSTIASKTAYVDGITVSDPVISQFNGTVALSCETPGASIEYSLDNETFNAYTRAFTLSEDATVYARATRANCTASSVVSAAVTTVSKGAANYTIWMGHGSFDNNTTNSMTGKSGDDAEGIVMAITGNADKKWSSGNGKINVGGIERTSIKLSNGAQNTITLPTGMKATRITFYSFINGATSNTKSYWKEFQGENISGADVPMGAWNDVADYLTTPDVRSFALTGEETSITFTNAGEQLCFIIALDVVVDPVSVTIPASGYATVASKYALDCANLPSGLKAYKVSEISASAATIVEVNEAVAAGTGLILEGAAGSYEIPVVATGTDISATNLLKAAVKATDVEADKVYVLKDGTFHLVTAASTVPAGKAYLEVPAESEARALTIEIGGKTTGINKVEAAVAGDAEIYNMLGQRVAQPTKGLYIVNGKKVIIK